MKRLASPSTYLRCLRWVSKLLFLSVTSIQPGVGIPQTVVFSSAARDLTGAAVRILHTLMSPHDTASSCC